MYRTKWIFYWWMKWIKTFNSGCDTIVEEKKSTDPIVYPTIKAHFSCWRLDKFLFSRKSFKSALNKLRKLSDHNLHASEIG